MFRLGYLSGNWMGTSKFPGVYFYCGNNFCQNEFPAVASDFMAGSGDLQKRFLLWTLMDPWQTSWLTDPEGSPYSNPSLARQVLGMRENFKWIMHFTMDGYGPDGGAPYWVDEFVESADYPVAMSAWARDILQKTVTKEIRHISHAIDVDVFKPGSKDEARKVMESHFIQSMAMNLVIQEYQRTKNQKEAAANVQKIVATKRLNLQGKFLVSCVMANRARKYWHYVLESFAELSQKLNGRAVLVGVCGDSEGRQEGALPLTTMIGKLGLRLAGHDSDPQVWLIESVGDSDGTLATILRASDVSLLISGGEGFGLPQLEAHACGVPCVVGDYSASSELILNKREGIAPQNYWWEGSNRVMRPVYKPSDIAGRLKWIYDNPEWAVETGQAGVEQAQERSWAKILPKWLELFHEAWGSFDRETIRSEPATATKQVEESVPGNPVAQVV
jgi:glycosyltransferase involved in cell wall biosynthesis